jgi:hypothetical protein
MSLRTVHVLGIVGAVVVVIATDLAWYTREVAASAGGAALRFTSSTSNTLWDITTLAPVLLVIAAAAGAIALFAPQSAARMAGIAAGLLGLGISAYCVVKMFNFPDLGTTGSASGVLPLPGAGGTGVSGRASTTLDAGPFIGLLGGLLVALSGLGLTSEAPETSTAPQHTPDLAGTPAR